MGIIMGVGCLILLMELAVVKSHVTREALWFLIHAAVAALLGVIAKNFSWVGIGYAGYVLLAWGTINLGFLRNKLIPVKRWPENWDWWHLFSFLSHWPIAILVWAKVGLDFVGSWQQGLLFLGVSVILGVASKVIWMRYRKKSWPTLTEQWRGND